MTTFGHPSLDKTLTKDVDSHKAKVLCLANKLLDIALLYNNTESWARKRSRPEHEEDITDDFRGIIVALIDQLLGKLVSSTQPIVVLTSCPVAHYICIYESHKWTQIRVRGSAYTV